jgi:hypothetical protein
MLGVVFTEFMEMVEDRFSMDMVDDILEDAAPASGGAYTAVGKYDPTEMLALVGALSARTGVSVGDLAQAFGNHLFGQLAKGHPALLDGMTTALDLLDNIESHIHTEVRKLYPNAELPRFETERPAPDRLIMVYHSSRPLAALAVGLIEGCAAHFGETLDIAKEDLSEGAGTAARFTIQRVATP